MLRFLPHKHPPHLSWQRFHTRASSYEPCHVKPVPLIFALLLWIVQWRDKYPVRLLRATISPKLKGPKALQALVLFGCCSPLTAIQEGWTSLYIMSVSLDRAQTPSPYSNGSLAYTPRDEVIPQIARKKMRLCLWQWILKHSVSVDVDLCSFWCCLHLSVWIMNQGCHGIYDTCRRVSQSHTWAPLVCFEARRQPVLQQTVQMTTCLGF